MFSAVIENDELVIRLPINKDKVLSKTGKSFVVATTSGNKITDLMVDGVPVTIGVNAYRPKA